MVCTLSLSPHLMFPTSSRMKLNSYSIRKTDWWELVGLRGLLHSLKRSVHWSSCSVRSASTSSNPESKSMWEEFNLNYSNISTDYNQYIALTRRLMAFCSHNFTSEYSRFQFLDPIADGADGHWPATLEFITHCTGLLCDTSTPCQPLLLTCARPMEDCLKSFYCKQGRHRHSCRNLPLTQTVIYCGSCIETGMDGAVSQTIKLHIHS